MAFVLTSLDSRTIEALTIDGNSASLFPGNLSGLLSDGSLPVDRNSLITSDFTHPFSGWQILPAGGDVNGVTMSPFQDIDIDGSRAATGINVGLNSNGDDLVCRFPAVSTSVSFSINIANLAGDATLILRLWNSAVSVAVDHQVVTTPTLTRYTVVFTGLVIGQYYYVGLSPTGLGPQSSYAISNPTLLPLGVTSGFFSQPFDRLAVYPAHLFGNIQQPNPEPQNQWWNAHSPLSELRIFTAAPTVAVEVFTIGSNDPIGYRVNGRPWASSDPITQVNGNVQVITQAMPAGIQNMALDISVGTNGIAGNPIAQSYWRALYVPSDAGIRLRPRLPSYRRLVGYGDSILLGVGSTQTWSNGIFGLLRYRWPGETVIEAAGGRTLFSDAHTGPQQLAFAELLSRGYPSDILFLIGVNDWATAPWTGAAAFGAAYTAVLAAIAARLPNTHLWVCSPGLTGLGPNNGQGETMAQYRTQVQNAAATQPLASFIDGTTLWSLGQLSGDQVHPTTEGHAHAYRVLSLAANLNI